MASDSRRRDDHAEDRAEIAADSQAARADPGGDRRGDHQRAVRKIEHAGNAEDQREARRAQRIERGDREAVDQDLPEQHWSGSGASSRSRPRAVMTGLGPVIYDRAITMPSGESTTATARVSDCRRSSDLDEGRETSACPLARFAGQRLTCSPFCHCRNSPVMKPAPIFSPWTCGSSLGRNWTRPIVPT